MIEQRTPEWHEARKGRVTGSNVGAILGLSPYQDRVSVLRSMVRTAKGLPNEFTGNAATEWGTHNEAGAIYEFEMETSECVTAMPFVPWEDWLGASPDGRVSDGRGLEVKCPYSLRNETTPHFKTVDEQPHYHAQMMIEMLCCGWESMWFWQWAPHGHQLALVHRDDEWLNIHIPILRQFHAEFLHELAENADEYLAPRRVEIDTPDAHKMVAEWDQLSEAIELATARKKELLAEIAKASGDRNSVFAGRKLTKVEKEGAISYASAVKALAPGANLEKWRGKPSSFWKLS